MWKRSELKKGSKSNLKRNYKATVVVCFILAILMVDYGASVSGITSYSVEKETTEQVVHQITTGSIGDTIVSTETPNADITEKATKGVLASVVNSATSTIHMLSGIKTMVFGIIQRNYVLAFLVGILSILIGILYSIFLKNTLKIGERRFFLESRVYEKSRLTRLFYTFTERKTGHVALVMLIRDLCLMLWTITIVMGPIKTYEYKMIPYILAENPDATWTEAHTISKKMMKGNKWKAFILDVTFILWKILEVITLGLVGIFFLNPYIRGTEAELFVSLRFDYIEAKKEGYELLNDIYLYQKPLDCQQCWYPDSYRERTTFKKRITIDYHRKYSVVNVILFFFTFSIIGWLWEVSLHLFKDGIFVNRGTLFGPWLPIYGAGGVIVLIALKKLIDKPVLTFFATMILCGIVEYSTSYYLEATKGIKWWDYSGYLLNLNGRICLEGLFVFALGGTAFIYLIAPLFDDLFNKIPLGIRYGMCAVLLGLFASDQVYSHYHPNTGKGITDYGSTLNNQKDSFKIAQSNNIKRIMKI
ncbi:MAG: DUF975 family protein [Anaerovoracaceae bacterium]